MKQFIVMAAVLPILLVFLIGFSEIQQQGAVIDAVDDTVYAAKEMAKQEGCFSKKVQDWLKTELCRRIKSLERDSIIIGSGTDTRPVPRAGIDGSSGLIRYRISVPVPARRAGALLGVRQDEKPKYYVIDSCTSSEYLPGSDQGDGL